jgi:4-diphosphocytidyl-2-C-methyl-D-erythritol kinase
MERKSYTRVTMALDIVRKIQEGPYSGYHELAIVKHQIDLHDIISVEDSSGTGIECDDPRVPCDESNICWKAVELIKNECGVDKNVKIHISKRIPVMGGMAGGSANAATMLELLNELWGLGLGEERLMSLGRKLGMDVPYFFWGQTALDSEATCCLMPLPTSLRFVFVIAVPDFGVSTSEAYRGIDYSVINRQHEKTEKMQRCFLENDRKGVLESMHNDFEASVFRSYPRLRELKAQLLEAGCMQAIMTGSGSTVIGIAENLQKAEDIRRGIDCRTFVSSTLEK